MPPLAPERENSLRTAKNSRRFEEAQGENSWHEPCSKRDMRTASNLLEPGPHGKRRGEETTRVFWKPPLPEATEPRVGAPARNPAGAPYLLAPRPWPRGQFRVDPEA